MPRPTDDWWADVERDLFECLDGRATTSLEAIARHLHVSEDAAASLVAILAHEGKVRISYVERADRHPRMS